MATIEKRGESYRIRSSNGYTLNGKQVRPSITWTPAPGMTERQIKKEVRIQAALFEEKIRKNTTVDSRIKFEAFTQIYIRDYVDVVLKPKTRQSYIENIAVLNAGLGHIKLCELRPTHINALYKNLQEEGVREKVTAVCKIDLAAVLKERGLSLSKAEAITGVSRATIKAATRKERITKDSAVKIADGLELKLTDAFFLSRDMTPLAPSTVAAYHRTLSSILTKAVKWGYLNSNPANRAEKPKLDRRESHYLEEADARRLLELLQQEPIRWRTIITFDLLSGLRRGELLGLRWTDVDLDGQLIQIRQTSNYLPGMGVYTTTPKSADSRRPLKLARSAMLLLQEYKDWQDAQREALGDAWLDRDGRVFTRDDGAPVFPDSVTQWFTDFVRRSGLPKVTVHSLRHTYASLLILDGTPLVVVSHNLGHAQASTTSNIYTHVIAEAEARAQEITDKRFGDLIAPAKKAQKRASGE